MLSYSYEVSIPALLLAEFSPSVSARTLCMTLEVFQPVLTSAGFQDSFVISARMIWLQRTFFRAGDRKIVKIRAWALQSEGNFEDWSRLKQIEADDVQWSLTTRQRNYYFMCSLIMVKYESEQQYLHRLCRHLLVSQVVKEGCRVVYVLIRSLPRARSIFLRNELRISLSYCSSSRSTTCVLERVL